MKKYNALKYTEDPNSIPNEELWSLDYTIAKFILPRLIAFRERFIKNKTKPISEQEFDKMILALEYAIITGEEGFAKYDLFNNIDVNEGAKLLGDNFFKLWH